MQKIAVFLLLCGTFLYGQVTYVVKASLLGEIGSVTLSEKKSKKQYQIDVYIEAKGIARSMSGNLKEHHTSKGNIKNGEYYAKEYTIKKTIKNKRYFKRYTFDYKRKKITKVYKKWKDGKLLYNRKRTLKYFSQNDLLTVYHNIMLFQSKGNTGTYTIKSAGAEQGDKKMRFTLFDKSKGRRMLKHSDMDVEGSVMEIFMRRSFFSNGKGSLRFLIDRKGITQKAILTHVKLLGDIVAKRVQ